MNSWNIGLHFGLTYPHTDISASGTRNPAYGLDVTKFLTHTTALQARFMRGSLSGTDVNRPLYQFESNIDYDISLNAFFQFGNIAFLKHNPNIAFYASIGVGVLHYTPDVYTDGGVVALPGVYSQYAQPLVEQDYESTTNLVVPLGVGMKYRLSETISLNGEYSFRKTNSDKLDGFYKLLSSDDNYSYFSVGATYHLGNKSKVIEWVNPMQALYNEMNEMNSKIELFRRDTDADGVPDYFDREPETPPGNKVYGDGTSVIINKSGTMNEQVMPKDEIKTFSKNINTPQQTPPAGNSNNNPDANAAEKISISPQEVLSKDTISKAVVPAKENLLKKDSLAIPPSTGTAKRDSLSIAKPPVQDQENRLESITVSPQSTPVLKSDTLSGPVIQKTEPVMLDNTVIASTSTKISESVLKETVISPPSPKLLNRLSLVNPDDTMMLQNYHDLPSIYFPVSENKIPSRQYRTVEYIALVMQNNPSVNFTILGICDAIGDPVYNFELGLRRAETVRRLLINSYDIAPGRLSAKTLGSIEMERGSNPLNRRVDINVSE